MKLIMVKWPSDELEAARAEHARAWREYRLACPVGYDPVLFAPVKAANERIGRALLGKAA